MNRLAFVLLLLVSLASFAGTGDPVPLCPAGAPPDCVDPNWGLIEPGAMDASIPATGPSLAAATTASKPRMAVQMMPAAATTQGAVAPLKSVVSPQNLFPKETAALLSALKRARFNSDGTIKTGEPAIRRAVAAAAQRAGNKYTLTLYIKVPQTLKPDMGTLLGKKVDALNAVLGDSYDLSQSGTPKS